MEDVFRQYAALIDQRTATVRARAPAGVTVDMRTALLIWESDLVEFLYFEEPMVASRPEDYYTEWHETAARGMRRASRSLWIYNRDTRHKRYSITTSANKRDCLLRLAARGEIGRRLPDDGRRHRKRARRRHQVRHRPEEDPLYLRPALSAHAVDRHTAGTVVPMNGPRSTTLAPVRRAERAAIRRVAADRWAARPDRHGPAEDRFAFSAFIPVSQWPTLPWQGARQLGVSQPPYESV